MQWEHLLLVLLVGIISDTNMTANWSWKTPRTMWRCSINPMQKARIATSGKRGVRWKQGTIPMNSPSKDAPRNESSKENLILLPLHRFHLPTDNLCLPLMLPAMDWDASFVNSKTQHKKKRARPITIVWSILQELRWKPQQVKRPTLLSQDSLQTPILSMPHWPLLHALPRR